MNPKWFAEGVFLATATSLLAGIAFGVWLLNRDGLLLGIAIVNTIFAVVINWTARRAAREMANI